MNFLNENCYFLDIKWQISANLWGFLKLIVQCIGQGQNKMTLQTNWAYLVY